MGFLLCPKSVFGLFATLFLLNLAASGDSPPNCYDLKEGSSKNDFLNCRNDDMRVVPDKNNTYPVADFSQFSQAEFDQMLQVKTITGLEKNAIRHFSGHFVVRSSELSTITIGFVVFNESLKQSFFLEDNWNLTEVVIGTPDRSSVKNAGNFTMKFEIRNNKRLTASSLENLNKIEYISDDSYIQELGECDFKDIPLSSTSELEDCHYTVGNIEIDGNTEFNATNLVLKEVRGCIKIQKTMIEDLSILKTIDSINCSNSNKIVENSNLCLHPEAVFDLKKWFNDTLEYRKNSDCHGECSSTYLLTHKDPECEIVNGTITINDTHNLTYLENVKVIRGRLVIRSTNLTEIELSKKLELIDGTFDESGPAVEVLYNAKLTNFKLPDKLKIKIVKLQKSLQVMQNGNFSVSDEDKEEWEKRFGKGSVMIDEKEIQLIENYTYTNSSFGGSKRKSKEKSKPKEEPALTEDQRNILIGVSIGAVVTSMIIAYFVWVIVVVILRRNEALRNYRTYAVMNMTELKVPQFKMVSYPFMATKGWITEAAKILEENAQLSLKQEEDRLKRAEDNPELFLQKNSDPVLPLYTRTDSKHRKFVHGIGKFEDKGALKERIPGVYERICLLHYCVHNCQRKAYNLHPAYCSMACYCSDYGIQNGSNAVFGVRMERVPVEKWHKEEIEKIHHLFFENLDAPITYEELSHSTLLQMEKEPMTYINSEREFQHESNKTNDTSISGVIDFKQEVKKKLSTRTSCCGSTKNEEESVKAVRKLNEVQGCVFRYNLGLYTYTGEKNSFEDVAQFDISARPPPICQSIGRTLIRTPIFGKQKENTNKFLEDMINAHMSCPLTMWLCDLTKDTLGEQAYVKVDINARIIGEIRGKFDDLRKGLCLPSKNAKKGHPLVATTHVFLGNYAGPYQQSMEVICLLFALKARLKDKYILLRGALDWREMGDVSGLKLEVNTRFPERALEVLSAINQVFDFFPLVCKVGRNILCTNAGIAPKMIEVKKLSLPIRDLVPDSLPFNLMFAQPNWTVKRFFDNVDQKAGYYFGYDSFDHTMDKFQCQALFCSKQLDSGYGSTGYAKRLFSLSAYTHKTSGYIAQAEYDVDGFLEIQVLIPGRLEKIEFNGDKPRPLDDAAKEMTNSYMNDVIPNSKMGVIEKRKSSGDNDKSTLSVVKTQCESVKETPPPEVKTPSHNGPAKNSAVTPASSGSKQ